MHSRIVPAALTALLLCAATAGSAPAQNSHASAAADTFRIDPSHMHIGFAVRHLGIAMVRGEFATARGMLVFDAADPLRSSVDIRIDATSLTTRNERRDTDIKDNFLETAAYPEIHFVSTRLEPAGDGFMAHGTLTMHGVTHSVALPFTFTGPINAPGGIIRIGVEGSGAVDRRDYGIALQRMADNALVVGNEVRLTFELEFGRRAEPAGN
jgi:polyisoprenoid-binding protein YceI